MNRNAVTLIILLAAALAAATYAASCHCGNPGTGVGAPGAQRSAPVSSPEPRALPEPRASASGAGGPLATHASRLTTSVSSDTDFLTPLRPSGFVGQAANRGPAATKPCEVGYGIETRDFGLANANPTVTGWQTTPMHGILVANGWID
ncbi:MAG: hypothetical protein HY897_15480 [Deltaproteobacteria bacterium]|nr:hypothetical protein [Deltaproteobacteria bacterium]